MNERSVRYGQSVRVTGCLTDRHNGMVGEMREFCSRDATYLVAFGDSDSCWTATMEAANA